MGDYCLDCPAFELFCDGSAEHPGRCRELDQWLEALDGLALDMPLAPQPQTALVFNNPSMDKYEPLVAPGGTLIYNSSLIDRAPRRTDITVVAVPANDIAADIGDETVANMVALGAAVAATGAVSLPGVIESLRIRSNGEPEMLQRDEAALRRGAGLVREGAVSG